MKEFVDENENKSFHILLFHLLLQAFLNEFGFRVLLNIEKKDCD